MNNKDTATLLKHLTKNKKPSFKKSGFCISMRIRLSNARKDEKIQHLLNELSLLENGIIFE